MAPEIIPEETRREVFAALVKAQDLGDSVQESRAMVASRFNLTEHDVRRSSAKGSTPCGRHSTKANSSSGDRELREAFRPVAVLQQHLVHRVSVHLALERAE
jgi:hypothetical protein